jgi:hypothetical protein
MVIGSQRASRVGQISRAIQKILDKGEDVKFEELVNQVNLNFETARRTSLEYINTALSNINHKILKSEGIKWIVREDTYLEGNKSNTTQTLLGEA